MNVTQPFGESQAETARTLIGGEVIGDVKNTLLKQILVAVANKEGGTGSGNVSGPSTATDNAIVRYDGTTGKQVQDSGIIITDGASGTLSGTNSGDQNLFGTIAVAGQSDVVADSTNDTLTLAAGTNVYITTDPTTDTITINATGGSGGGDVSGPAVATDNALVRFDGTTGKFIQNSSITVADGASGTLSGTNSGDVTISTANGLSLAGQAISLGTASAATTGALTSTDWSTFNDKQAAGSYMTALTGDVTASGPGSSAATLATVNANVGSFGSATAAPVVTVNAKGLVTAVSTNTITPAVGSITGLGANVATSLANPISSAGTLAITADITKTAVGLSNVTNDTQTKAAVVPNTAPSSGQILVGNAGGTAYAPVAASGDATLASTGALTLATVNSNVGSFGSATAAPAVTVNAKGLVTAVSTNTITPAVGSITGLGTNVATSLGNPMAGAGTLAITADITKTAVGLSNVTNDTQTKAAVVPNTAPSAGQILVGNAGGTAYAPVSASGDATLGSTGALTLATVNANVGSFGSATQSLTATVNAKGLVTAVSTQTVTPAVGSITGLGTGVATALAINTGSAGAVVVSGGALDTPSSGTLTNATGLPLSTGVTGDLPFANLTPATAASKLLGRGSASGAGDFEEIALGTGLSMSGTTLSSSGGTATTDNRLYTANDTWTNPSPSTAKRVFVRLVGGGGGGGSGRRGAAGSVRCGGGGGASACFVEYWALTTDFAGTVSVTVGAGGTGGAAQTTDSTNGNPGIGGGDTTFGDSTAKGGGGGGAGTTGTGTGGAAVSNGSFIGFSAGSASTGGAASTTGGAGNAGTAGAGHTPSAGGAGGGISSTDVVANGGAGGTLGNANIGQITVGSAGTAGGNGGNGTSARGSGTGGGGGASSKTTNAGAGGNGGGFGSGGGGGGASLDATGNSGKGGDGGGGYALIITYL